MPVSRHVDVDGVRISLRVWPCDTRRPPAVLVPATGATADDWDLIAASLQNDRTVYAVDQRGHGDSSWPGHYRFPDFVGDLIGVLTWLDEPVDLVGHSLGGLVACGAAAAHPDRVRRLVLEDVPFPHPRRSAMPDRPDGELSFDWRVVEQIRPELDDPDPAWAQLVVGITSPTLVVGGGADSEMSQQHVAELADRLSDARLVTIPAGHLVHEVQPVAFTRAVTQFLAD